MRAAAEQLQKAKIGRIFQVQLQVFQAKFLCGGILAGGLSRLVFCVAVRPARPLEPCQSEASVSSLPDEAKDTKRSGEQEQ